MTPEGTTATGWEEAGLQTSDMGSNIVQLLPLAEATPQGLFVMWKDMRGDYVFNYYGQHISRDGERLWDDAGVNLADRGSEQELPAIATTGTGIVFAWCENVNGMHDIAAQKYSFPVNLCGVIWATSLCKRIPLKAILLWSHLMVMAWQ
jgi:hypothetical protein